MKATIVLLASIETENFGRKCMLKANKAAGLGFEMARLLHHISLKQPFKITDLNEVENIFDELANEFKAVFVPFVQLDCFPSNIFGYESGVLSIRAEKTPELEAMQKRLFGAKFENYINAHQLLKEKDYQKVFYFDRLGLLYYDDDNYKPGTYFCYKVAKLRE